MFESLEIVLLHDYNKQNHHQSTCSPYQWNLRVSQLLKICVREHSCLLSSAANQVINSRNHSLFRHSRKHASLFVDSVNELPIIDRLPFVQDTKMQSEEIRRELSTFCSSSRVNLFSKNLTSMISSPSKGISVFQKHPSYVDIRNKPSLGSVPSRFRVTRTSVFRRITAAKFSRRGNQRRPRLVVVHSD